MSASHATPAPPLPRYTQVLIVTIQDKSISLGARARFKSEMAVIGVSVVFLAYESSDYPRPPLYNMLQGIEYPSAPSASAQVIVSGGGNLTLADEVVKTAKKLYPAHVSWKAEHPAKSARTRTVSPESRQRMSATQKKRGEKKKKGAKDTRR